MVKTCFIFVSHSYRDAHLYRRLIDQLCNRRRFNFQDKSVPNIAQVPNSIVRASIRKRIVECNVMLVFTSPIATKSKMIQFELSAAKRLKKKIVAIKPPETKNIADVVRKAADIVIEWDIDEIVWQIRNPNKTVRPQAKTVVADTYTPKVDLPSPTPQIIATPALHKRSFKDVLRRMLERSQRSSRRTPPLAAEMNLPELNRDNK